MGKGVEVSWARLVLEAAVRSLPGWLDRQGGSECWRGTRPGREWGHRDGGGGWTGSLNGRDDDHSKEGRSSQDHQGNNIDHHNRGIEVFQIFLQKMGALGNCVACSIMASAGEKVNGVSVSPADAIMEQAFLLLPQSENAPNPPAELTSSKTATIFIES